MSTIGLKPVEAFVVVWLLVVVPALATCAESQRRSVSECPVQPTCVPAKAKNKNMVVPYHRNGHNH